MPLVWDVKNVKNFKEVTSDPFNPENWSPVTQQLITLSMICGYNSINEKNAEEVFRRICLYRSVIGESFFFPRKKRIEITLEDITDHIGLNTNAATFGNREFDRLILLHMKSKAEKIADRLKNVRSARKRLQYMATLAKRRSGKNAKGN